MEDWLEILTERAAQCSLLAYTYHEPAWEMCVKLAYTKYGLEAEIEKGERTNLVDFRGF